jgi:UDPglucose--hexose-1-phosphate uridylyltransferase
MTPRREPAPGTARPPLLHHDPLSGRLAFVAPQRAERPSDGDLGGRDDGADPRSWCPFCAGNEDRTPAAVLRAPPDDARAWHARIVPNRYPMAIDLPAAAGDAAVRPARGVHDVVVESERHVATILAIDADAWCDVWTLCQERLSLIAARGDLAWGTVFKNSGPRAGASLEHVHSQLVALDFVPPLIEAELAAAAADTAAFTRLVDDAARTGRIVAATGGLVALSPPAPRQPFETWILPTRPAPFFHAAAHADVAALAALTRLVVGRLARVVPGADYNWWLHQAPFVGRGRPVESWHWHLEILPRLAAFAGFELGTGCHISTLPPEDAAALLRDG